MDKIGEASGAGKLSCQHKVGETSWLGSCLVY